MKKNPAKLSIESRFQATEKKNHVNFYPGTPTIFPWMFMVIISNHFSIYLGTLIQLKEPFLFVDV